MATKTTKATGLLAMVLGVLGLITSTVVVIVSLWITTTTTGRIDNILNSVDERSQNITTEVNDFKAEVDQAETPKQLKKINKQLNTSIDVAEQKLDTLVESRIYSNLPSDLHIIEKQLSKVRNLSDSMEGLTEGTTKLTSESKTKITNKLDTIETQIQNTQERLDNTGKRMNFWLRVLTLGLILTALWGFWAQYTLFKSGLKKFRS